MTSWLSPSLSTGIYTLGCVVAAHTHCIYVCICVHKSASNHFDVYTYLQLQWVMVLVLHSAVINNSRNPLILNIRTLIKEKQQMFVASKNYKHMQKQLMSCKSGALVFAV